MNFGYEITSGQIAGIFQEIRKNRPLIHMIPNTVSAALCADGLSALGARPLMAVAEREMAEITQQADASVINLGQPDFRKLEAARIVLDEASRLEKPLVLDPVGCGASHFRLESVQEILSLPWQGIIKGNCSEIYSIQQNRVTREGIDAVTERNLLGRIPQGRVYLVTGKEDRILWAEKSLQLFHERGSCPQGMSRYNIVGSGCLAGAVAGACYSVIHAADKDREKEKVTAAAAASLGMAFSLERSALAKGYGMAKVFLLDALCELAGAEFEGWLKQRMERPGGLLTFSEKGE